MGQYQVATMEGLAAKPQPQGTAAALAKHDAVISAANAPVVDAPLFPVPKDEPGFFSDILPAAARANNTTYGVYHDWLEAEHHDIDLSYKFSEHADELRKDIPSEYWNRLPGFRSLGDAQKERAGILREIEDKKTLEKAGFVGAATSMALMLADAPTLVGGYGEAFALSNMLTKGARLKNLATGAKVGFLAAVGQEAALQSTTHTRGTEDLIYAGVLGPVVGGALGAFSKQGRDLAKEIQLSMDRKLAAETPMQYTTRAEAMDFASNELGVAKPEAPVIHARPKETAKAEVLRKDIADMTQQLTEERAALVAKQGASHDAEEAAALGLQIKAVEDQYKPLIQTAEMKLGAIEERLGMPTVQTATEREAQLAARTDEILALNKAEVDKHTALRKAAEQRVNIATSDMSLHVPDTDMYDDIERVGAEFVNGVKGYFKKVGENQGETSAMFVPWFDRSTKPKLTGQFSDLTDKMAKHEISDRDASIVHDFLDKLRVHGEGTPESPLRSSALLSDVLDHAELYNAYPSAKDIEINFTRTGVNAATYHPQRNLIDVSISLVRNPDKVKELVLHEVQHAVQTESGFARGTRMTGNSQAAYDAYHFSAGEEEARRTAKRRNLVDEARIGKPYEGTDVDDPTDLIVKQYPKGKSATDLRGTPMDAFVPYTEGVDSHVKRVHTDPATPENLAAESRTPDVLDAAGNVVQPSRDILADAIAMDKAGVFKGNTETRSGKAVQFLGGSDSAAMSKMNSPISKLIDHELLSSASGTTSSAGTAAVTKFQHLKVMLSSFMPDLSTSYKQFAHENNISHWNLKKYYGEGMEQWNKEVRVELETRRNAWRDELEHTSTAPQHIQDAADALQRVSDYALDLGKATRVRGFEELIRQPGYAPLLWSGRALRKLGNGTAASNELEIAAHEALLSKGYAAALGITPDDAKRYSKAVIRRALHNDLGLDANPRSVFSGDARGFLRQALEESDQGLSKETLDAMFARIDARQADKGMSARAKRRTDIDLLVTDEQGRSLLNIVENDLPAMFTRYSSEMSGRAALATKGIASEADWTRLREKAILAASSYGDDVNKTRTIIDSTYNQFLGRPAGGGVNKNARRLMDLATVASLGQVGWAQMAEWAPIIAAHGIGGMFEIMPELKAYRAAMKAGTVPQGVYGEIQPLYGRISEEQMLFRPDIRLDDKLSDDPAWLRMLDKGLGQLNNISGKLSLMHQIKDAQQQVVVLMQANKVAKAVRAGEWSKLSARFEKLGWDESFMQELKDVSKHFEWEGGTLQRLNIEQWKNPVMTDKFIQGLHIHVNQLVQSPMIGETAYWMHPTVGAMLTQFRTFPLVAMEKQMARHMQMADEEAMYTAMYGLGLSAMVYTAKVGFNAQGKGKDKQKYLNDRLSIEAITKGSLQYATIAGPILDVSNIAVAAGLAPKIMSSSNVGRAGGQKQANLSLSDIPSLGTGLKIFNGATGLGKGLLDPSYNYSKKDLANIQGAMPLGNTPFLAIPWNVAKDSID